VWCVVVSVWKLHTSPNILRRSGLIFLFWLTVVVLLHKLHVHSASFPLFSLVPSPFRVHLFLFPAYFVYCSQSISCASSLVPSLFCAHLILSQSISCASSLFQAHFVCIQSCSQPICTAGTFSSSALTSAGSIINPVSRHRHWQLCYTLKFKLLWPYSS